MFNLKMGEGGKDMSKLEQAIIKAVPGIEIRSYCGQHRKPERGCGKCEGTIIRPITLEDVLRAIDNPITQSDGKITQLILENINGEKLEFGFYDVKNPEAVWFTGIDWNLGKPLSDQSKETKDWLEELIV